MTVTWKKETASESDNHIAQLVPVARDVGWQDIMPTHVIIGVVEVDLKKGC